MARISLFQVRRDTAANWTSANPVLASGEQGLETDTRLFKFGDGVTTWSALQYASADGGASAFEELTDAAVAPLPTVNAPLATALAAKASTAAVTAVSDALATANVEIDALAETTEQATTDIATINDTLETVPQIRPSVTLTTSTMLTADAHAWHTVQSTGVGLTHTVQNDATSGATDDEYFEITAIGSGTFTMAAGSGVTFVSAPGTTLSSANAVGNTVAVQRVVNTTNTYKAMSQALVPDTFNDQVEAVIGSMFIAAGGDYDAGAGTISFPPSGAVPFTVSGATPQGSTLTATASSGWIIAPGNWTRAGSNISGATSLTYATQVADVGSVVTYKPTNIAYAPTGITVTNALPTVVTATIENATRTTMTIDFSGALTSSAPTGAGGFVITATPAMTVTAVAITSGDAVLTLSRAAVAAEVITIAYTKPGANNLTSATGEVANFSGQAVTNNVLSAAALSTLTDDFSSDTMDGSKWALGYWKGSNNTSVVVTQGGVNDDLTIQPLADTSGTTMNGYVSVNTYTIDDSYGYVMLHAALASAGNNKQATFAVYTDANNAAYYQFGTGSGFTCRTLDGGVDTAVGSAITYSSTTHKWLRIREEAGTIYWDGAPSTASNPPISADWVNLRSVTTPAGMNINSVKAGIAGGTIGTQSAPTSQRIKTFNTTQ
jgi:hypothetical protein